MSLFSNPLSPKPDPLLRPAEQLVGAANILGVSSYTQFAKELPIIYNIDTEQWDWVFTIAGVFIATTDNTQNDSDVFVKLVYHATQQPLAVRGFFIRAHEQFRITIVRAGLYDIRYRDLDSGVISKSEPFKLEEIQVVGGTQYSEMRLTLYKVRGGNIRMETISEEEF